MNGFLLNDQSIDGFLSSYCLIEGGNRTLA